MSSQHQPLMMSGDVARACAASGLRFSTQALFRPSAEAILKPVRAENGTRLYSPENVVAFIRERLANPYSRRRQAAGRNPALAPTTEEGAK